jgi:hypothetical protein
MESNSQRLTLGAVGAVGAVGDQEEQEEENHSSDRGLTRGLEAQLDRPASIYAGSDGPCKSGSMTTS